MVRDILRPVEQLPAAQDLLRRLEAGGLLSCAGVSRAAQPFLASLLHYRWPSRPVIVITEGVKTQETFQQDLETWTRCFADPEMDLRSNEPLQRSTSNPNVFFYPAWEVLPHEDKLPHADVISERLETLVRLATLGNAKHGDDESKVTSAPIVITTVAALMQRTFSASAINERTRTLRRGDRMNPLDLVEWLEDQGYEPEAKVSSKGEISLRGGILDIYPLTSPWPVRVEFFGDELESLRHFDPVSQISREQIDGVTLPPAGEIGVLKKLREEAAQSSSEQRSHFLASLLDYLPTNPIFVLCDPALLDEHAAAYARQLPDDDPFCFDWNDLRREMLARGMTVLQVHEAEQPNAAIAHQTPTQIANELLSQDEGFQTQSSGPGYAAADTSETGDGNGVNAAMDGRTLRGLESAISSEDSLWRFSLSLPNLDAYRPLSDRAQEPQIAEMQRRDFFKQLHRWLRQGYALHVFCNNEGERQRFGEIWQEYGLSEPGHVVETERTTAREAPAALRAPHGSEHTRPRDNIENRATIPPPTSPNLMEALSPRYADATSGPESKNAGAREESATVDFTPALHLGTLTRGFLSHEAKVVVVTDAEIFGRYKVQRPRRLKSPHAAAARSALDIDFTDLSEGDYVVHLQHGIGRYLGLQVLPVGAGTKRGNQPAVSPPQQQPTASSQECLVIEYASNDPDQPPPKLYVPVTEAHLVSKYVGAGKARPALDSLGGARWAKTKAQAEQAVRDLASELLAIQAARESQPGLAFAPDAPWQREFESAFIYEETPDQMRAIVQTKTDMEAAKPMDRLICGDVGYGKTEVAIRAAFKAVMGGRQVAVLVPTTVLAQQHFNTFRERMADYPIRIEQLSRFRTPGEQRNILRQLGDGSIDVVIGTHRLIQEDVSFKDLGLVVIDEEQRFGVLHKEKFKMLRRLVDVLTLSATPIPRTLYLALTGARDMSTIETPPQDRLPVETIVAQYDERLIRDAIQRELNREGQVYFLHNRVFDIESVALRIRTLVPQARVLVGHGQLDNDDLEEIMTKFVNGEADVLVSTTIIESGIDIPNANTIIIDRADRFGLSDLYQLRGRVGRYKHQAYAYLLLPRHAALLSDVRKRISAIRQYSSLGSGFKIAMRDLEIRGAGNLLGPQQSGHITAVGFELYCQLLKQSVSALKGEKVRPRVDVQVRLDFLAMSPGEEMAENSSKFEVRSPRAANIEINLPREPATCLSESSDAGSDFTIRNPQSAMVRSAAYIPFKYVPEAQQRIDLYRKVAQVTDKPSLQRLREELRDRFGKFPAAVELLLSVSELRYLAAERGISAIQTKDDRLMLTRNNDFIMIHGKFPRLTKRDARSRLGEIKKLLLAL